MSSIHRIVARQIIDSRGNPTVEADVITQSGALGRAAVPSGASTGKHEAVELRDNKKAYLGQGVQKAVNNIHSTIFKVLKKKEVSEQKMIDELMIEADGTPNKKKLGANAILAVSLAVAKAAATEKNIPLFKYVGKRGAARLPIPMMNILNGGAHADNKIDFQEFMIVPHHAKTFSIALQQGTEIFHHLKSVLKAKKYGTNVGDEGGFAPNIRSNEEAIEVVLEAITKAGYAPGKDIGIALDAASSEMWNDKTASYAFYKSSKKKISNEDLVDYWASWVKQYPIISIEDGMAEDDWDGWQYLTEAIGDKVQLVGDDLFVTNVTRFKQGIDNKIANSILIKVNQIGTLTETISAVKLAHKNGYTTVMSHRSGETEDTTIADLAVGLNCGQIKTGSLSRTDRTSKYNQLLRIEETLGKKAIFPSWNKR